MTPEIVELGVGFFGGGLGQVVANAFKSFNSTMSVLRDFAAAQHEQAKEIFEARAAEANAAAKRNPTWFRASLAFLVVGFLVTMIYTAGWTETRPLNVAVEKDPWFNFFGLLRFGGGVVFEELRGFVMTEEFGQAFRVIIGAVFGIHAFKPGH